MLRRGFYWASESHGAARYPATPKATRSAVAFWGFGVLAGFKLGEPSIGFVGRHVQAGGLIVVPGGASGLAKLFAFFFPLDVLLNSFAHDPVRRTAPGRGEPPHPVLGLAVEFQAGQSLEAASKPSPPWEEGYFPSPDCPGVSGLRLTPPWRGAPRCYRGTPHRFLEVRYNVA